MGVADAPIGTGSDPLARLMQLGRPLVMGILNVTPDSFSDGGLFIEPAVALAHARRVVRQLPDSDSSCADSPDPGNAIKKSPIRMGIAGLATSRTHWPDNLIG